MNVLKFSVPFYLVYEKKDSRKGIVYFKIPSNSVLPQPCSYCKSILVKTFFIISE